MRSNNNQEEQAEFSGDEINIIEESVAGGILGLFTAGVLATAAHYALPHFRSVGLSYKIGMVSTAGTVSAMLSAEMASKSGKRIRLPFHLKRSAILPEPLDTPSDTQRQSLMLPSIFPRRNIPEGSDDRNLKLATTLDNVWNHRFLVASGIYLSGFVVADQLLKKLYPVEESGGAMNAYRIFGGRMFGHWWTVAGLVSLAYLLKREKQKGLQKAACDNFAL